MKLWIDDIRPAPSEDWTVAKTVTSAIRALARFGFDEISIDHDISHQVTVGSLGRPYPCDECFCAVAYYLFAKFVDKPKVLFPKITLHSSNPVGAKEMFDILRNCEIVAEIKPTNKPANRLEMEI